MTFYKEPRMEDFSREEDYEESLDAYDYAESLAELQAEERYYFGYSCR